MKWYEPYLSVYEKPFEEAPEPIIEEVKGKIAAINHTDAEPTASVVAIAHNEDKRLLSCIWSLCNNVCPYPFEIIVINNHSTDNTEYILKELGVTYYNEPQKGPGHARQCGLNHARGRIHICIDCDTLYPQGYIQTMIEAFQKDNTVCAYSLWSFIPNKDNSRITLFFYELFRDFYLILQNIKRPELNVRGMVFAFQTEAGKKEGFRTDIIRGEDGSLALALKKYGKLEFVRKRKARVMTGYGTIGLNGSLIDSFTHRFRKGMKGFFKLFTSQSEYKDEESNLIKNK